MVKPFEQEEYWALIIGGSSGLGAASALELAKRGMNICIVHRDRRGAMEEIDNRFNAIRATGVQLLTFNKDGLRSEVRTEILVELKEQLARGGRIRTLLHSVAKGNLKPIRCAKSCFYK